MNTMNFVVDAHIGRYADPKRVMKECLDLLPATGEHNPEIDFGDKQTDEDHACAAFWFKTKDEAQKYRDALLNVKGIFSLFVGEKGVDF
jgi:hypothetical protein